jgi:hypothetical protein
MEKSIIKKLESWLSRGYSITPLQALDKWNCMRLGARINELRNAGMPIVTHTVRMNGKSFAKYSLAK